MDGNIPCINNKGPIRNKQKGMKGLCLPGLTSRKNILGQKKHYNKQTTIWVLVFMNFEDE